MIASYCNVDNQPVPSHVQASNIYLKQSTKPTASLTEMTSVLGQALTNLVSGGRSQLLAKVAWRQKFCGFSSTRLGRCSLGGNIPQWTRAVSKDTQHSLSASLATSPVDEACIWKMHKQQHEGCIWRTHNNTVCQLHWQHFQWTKAVSERHTNKKTSDTTTRSLGASLALAPLPKETGVLSHFHLEQHQPPPPPNTLTWSIISKVSPPPQYSHLKHHQQSDPPPPPPNTLTWSIISKVTPPQYSHLKHHQQSDPPPVLSLEASSAKWPPPPPQYSPPPPQYSHLKHNWQWIPPPTPRPPYSHTHLKHHQQWPPTEYSHTLTWSTTGKVTPTHPGTLSCSLAWSITGKVTPTHPPPPEYSHTFIWSMIPPPPPHTEGASSKEAHSPVALLEECPPDRLLPQQLQSNSAAPLWKVTVTVLPVPDLDPHCPALESALSAAARFPPPSVLPLAPRIWTVPPTPLLWLRGTCHQTRRQGV